ncbi:hypothetical protein OIU77_028945 [Salix suchowensis]|uniref:Uncharacterized protein n=1 Tax=Salix suchowensis TaxID=1278906 RepID=A0ABQ9BL05_9ROSI|nr:hypothetical protein OIU77_028945 [Salix suchowensis]
MGVHVSWRVIILCALLVLLFAEDSSAREITPRRWKVAPDLQQLSKNNHLLVKHNIDDDHQKHARAHLSSHMDHTDPSDKIFFTIEDLKSWQKNSNLLLP